MDDPELAIRYSYYKLYSEQQVSLEAAAQSSVEDLAYSSTEASNHNNQPLLEDHNNNTTNNAEKKASSPDCHNDNDNEGNIDNEAEDAHFLWTTDTWTTQDQAQAQATMARHADKCQLSAILRRKLPSDTQAWNQFYRQHATNFFKDRHYLATAFPHEFTIASSPQNESIGRGGERQKRTLVEIGCGVGNTLLPLLEERQGDKGASIEWTVYGIDLSAVAVGLLRQDARFQAAATRAWAGVANLVTDGLPEQCIGVADVATLLFCLSAIAPGPDQVTAARNAAQALRPGGVLVVRDYGRFDQAELQLASQRAKRLSDHYYVKHDHTKCYYFTIENLRQLFVEQQGLQELENDYIQRQYQNRGDGTRRRRVWVQARFRKPPATDNEIAA